MMCSRTSATRASKAEAQAWGMREEAAILAGSRGEFPDRTLAEAIERYRREVTDKKRNQRADHLRFDETVWRTLTQRMKAAGMNLVVIDLGEALQPVFTVIVGVAVLVLFVSLFLPLINMIDQLGNTAGV